MAGKTACKEGSVALPHETFLPTAQVFTVFQAKERLWKKKHGFVDSNTVIQLERVQILIYFYSKRCRKINCM